MRKIAAIVSILFALTVHAAAPKAEPIVDHWWQVMPTIGDARSIQICVEAYRQDHGRYPAAANLAELKALVAPIYIREFPEKDHWGTPFVYEVAADGKSYTIASAGSDRQFSRDAWSEPGFTIRSADDLVYRNDGFAREWIIQRVCK